MLRSDRGVTPRFTGARFRHPWRPYQARVLRVLDAHLADDHLHVVAPPGSGKTVLGLEALRHLGRPALVLAPTLTIREQWIERLLHDFESEHDLSPAISCDALAPNELTFLTYQGLYAVFRAGREEALLAALRTRGVGVLAVDEAHHLRSEWWRCLDRVKQALDGVQILALTATPPFDAPAREWRRYAAFCGEVDEEIGVPELVRDGNLCPHQDLLLLFAAEAQCQAALREFEAGVQDLVAGLALDAQLAEALAALPELAAPEQHVQSLSASAEFWLAVAVHLGNLRWEAARGLIAALGLSELRLPAFDARWAQRLLHGLLVDRSVALPAAEETLAALRRRLETLGALERGRLSLQRHPRQERLLESARGMIEASAEIVQAELAHFGARLRAVILSDHVRAECFPRPGDEAPASLRLGVVPLFERIRRLRLPELRPAVLTGTLLVLPAASLPAWRDARAARGFEAGAATPLPHAPDYHRVELETRLRSLAVPVATELFERGDINLICGTSALLGEGWDAPAVNSLVLASTVSAHVSSNQLRGRGIRAQRGNPYKYANLWHLVGVEIVDPAAGADAIESGPPPQMATRFRGFVGLRHDEDAIESGLQRLGPCRERLRRDEFDDWNRRSFARAAEAHHLPQRWQRAIGAERADGGRMLRELRLAPGPLAPGLAFVSRYAWQAPDWLRAVPGWNLLGRHLARRRLAAIARGLAAALVDIEALAADAAPRVDLDAGGELRVVLASGDYLSQTRFIEALAELFDPLRDPRYLVLSRHRYYAVPSALCPRKPEAEGFLRHWRHHVGQGELLYTRNSEGRLHLLRAKERLLAHFPDWRIEQRARWRSL